MLNNLYLLAKLRLSARIGMLRLRLFFLKESIKCRVIHRLALITATIRNR